MAGRRRNLSQTISRCSEARPGSPSRDRRSTPSIWESLNRPAICPPRWRKAGAGWRIYPPQFLALILPLGLLSFKLAWLVFDLVGIAAFWIGLKRLVSGNIMPIIACASPAVLMCAFQGQSSLMVAALLAGSLASLRRGQHILAGVLLACLTIKPQFGPLLPLALIACGNWRVIGWAVAASLMILMATLAWVGPDYWGAFIEGLSNAATWVKIGWLPRHLMITWYAFGIGTDLPANWAGGLQLGFTVLLALVVIWTWRRPLPEPR
jgi:hypothetical protein